MNYKPFPNHYWTDIQEKIKDLKQNQQPLFAAFDADGTLWDTDLGENFFQYQIDNKLITLPPDPWAHYNEMKKHNNDPRTAYLWLAQINSGKKLVEVKSWSMAAFKEIQPSPIFSEQKKLIELLRENNVKVYIVTASYKWAVVPGALALGLKEDDVIGVETEIDQGVVTDLGLAPITYRQGKVEALLKSTNNINPFLSAGNTMGDYELIKTATKFHLCVSAAAQDDKLYRTELELQNEAKKHNWWGHRFI